MNTINKEYQNRQQTRFLLPVAINILILTEQFFLPCISMLMKAVDLQFYQTVTIFGNMPSGALWYNQFTFQYPDNYPQKALAIQPSATYENEASDAQEYAPEYAALR